MVHLRDFDGTSSRDALGIEYNDAWGYYIWASGPC